MVSVDQGKFRDELFQVLKELSDTAWAGRVTKPDIDRWLGNFTGQTAFDAETEQLHALHLLSVFIYFGDVEVRQMLRSVFRDLYKYPIVERIRRDNADTTDLNLIKHRFELELNSTRFLGMGNPSESGDLLLYYFRQENHLPKDIFIHSDQIFSGQQGSPDWTLTDPLIRHYVYLDDFCGSGSQAQDYSANAVTTLKHLASQLGLQVSVSYFVLVGLTDGIEQIRNSTAFDNVGAVIELDESFRAFSPQSRFYRDGNSLTNRSTALEIAKSYGLCLEAAFPLGWKDAQLLIGFHHNIPDNSLPILWYEDQATAWVPIFKRYPKF